MLNTLSAINTMLSGIGELPVNNINSTLPEAQQARRILEEQALELSSQQMFFNTLDNVSISIGQDGSIASNLNLLNIEFMYDKDQYKILGGQVINRSGEVVTNTEIPARITINVPFDDMPYAAQRYVEIRATRVFADRMAVSDSLHRFTTEDEERAFLSLRRENIKNSQRNMKNNAVVNNIINRRL